MTRSRAMWLALAVVALWPIAQRAIVERAHASPWELFGWGMYARPELPVEVRIETTDGATVDPRTLGSDVRRAQIRLAERSRILGELASTDQLARTVLATRRDLPAVVIVRRFSELRSDGRVHEHVRRDQSQPPPPPDDVE